MLTRDEIRKYLDRLEYDKIPAPDLETLHALQWAHLTHVPYENIDARSASRSRSSRTTSTARLF